MPGNTFLRIPARHINEKAYTRLMHVACFIPVSYRGESCRVARVLALFGRIVGILEEFEYEFELEEARVLAQFS